MDIKDIRLPSCSIITRRQLVAGVAVAITVGLIYFYGHFIVGGNPASREVTPALKEIPESIPQKTVPTPLFIHVAGEVLNPGVFKLAKGKRVIDAVQAAGGPRPEADLDAVNLAALLVDCQRVFIPARGRTPAAATSQEQNKISLNSATAAELQDLPGVGEVLSARIIEERERKGRFQNLEELREIEGIGPKKFERMKDSLVLD